MILYGGVWMTAQIFAERLNKALKDKNMKQVDLLNKATEMGIKLGKSQISQYVSGKTFPRDNVLKFLAKILEVEEAWLAGADSTYNMEEKVTPMYVGDSVSSKDSKILNNERGNGMKEFKKSAKLENVLYDVRGPVADEAARMEQAGTHILKLNIGNPAPFGFRTPDEVIYDMKQQLTDCEGYSDSKGLFAARKAIMQSAQLKNIPNVSIDDIYTGNGVSDLIQLSMSALLDSGDEVLIPSPDYPLWTACVTLAGGKAVHYVCDEQADWNPDIADIKKKVNANTKAIVIINPNNPTGALYPKEVLQEIVEIAREHQLMIFSDEIYD